MHRLLSIPSQSVQHPRPIQFTIIKNVCPIHQYYTSSELLSGTHTSIGQQIKMLHIMSHLNHAFSVPKAAQAEATIGKYPSVEAAMIPSLHVRILLLSRCRR